MLTCIQNAYRRRTTITAICDARQALLPGRRGVVLKARHVGTPYVPRSVVRSSLQRASKRSADKILLMPPYLAAHELRVIFSMDYASVFRLLGVRRVDKKYYWRDYDKRCYETVTKRKVLFPFNMVHAIADSLGFKPRMVDVEPDWSDSSPAMLARDVPAVPVVAVLGHINHGKTTLIDRLCGTAYVKEEPGNITQEVRVMTPWFDPRVSLDQAGSNRHILTFEVPRKDAEPEARGAYDANRLTLLDTPGHEAFEVQRGRTVASADVAVVVVSAERGAEVQTEEVLRHASKWQVPVVFALNKVDLPDAHVELTKAELRRQCQRLHEGGDVDVDWTKEAEEAVPISALQGWNLGSLMKQVKKAIAARPSFPSQAVPSPSCTPGEAVSTRKFPKRTDFLMGVDAPPHAVALVAEVRRTAENGESVLTLIVRAGRLVVGHYFVVGTAMGRISHLALASGTDATWRKEKVCMTATAGVAVHLAGLKKSLGGDCAPDDYLFTFDRERAWRLSEYRRRLERLSAIQVDGPSLQVPWIHDSIGSFRTQAGFERSRQDHPEQHSNTAYERRWLQPAVEDITVGAADGDGPFTSTDRRTFEEPFREGGGIMQPAIGVATPSAAPRRRPAEDGRRFLVAEPDDAQDHEDTADQSTQEQASGSESSSDSSTAGGRKSRRTAAASSSTSTSSSTTAASSSGGSSPLTPWGAWSGEHSGFMSEPASEGDDDGGEKKKADFVYYVERDSWKEEATVDTRRLRERWQWRDRMRWEEQDKQAELRRKEKELTEQIRRSAWREEEEENEEVYEDDEEDEEDGDADISEPLPDERVPVIPLILKAKTSSQFDVLMDEMEQVQGRFGVRVAIVHGGLGPVIPKDVTHAEVEKYYGFCPIYAFQVGSHPMALGQAERERIDIRRFDVFTDLVADVEARCHSVLHKMSKEEYLESLKRQPTPSGW